jgi:hypothetical protein
MQPSLPRPDVSCAARAPPVAAREDERIQWGRLLENTEESTADAYDAMTRFVVAALTNRRAPQLNAKRGRGSPRR